MHEHVISDAVSKGRAKPFPVSDLNGFKQFAHKGNTLSPEQMVYDVMICWFILIILPNMSLFSMELSAS